MTDTYRDLFSYLPLPFSIEFDGGRIEPVETIEQARSLVAEWERDGFFEPITVQYRESPPGSGWTKVPDSEAWGHIFRLPPTHSVTLCSFDGTQGEARNGPAAFVVHFAGSLYGYRSQFDGWWFDARLPLRATPDHPLLTEREAGECLSTGFREWARWPARAQRVAINCLYLHARARSYYWDWERFQAEYQVFDALFSIARDVHGVNGGKNPPHPDRLAMFCRHFDLALPDLDYIRTLVDWRNDLVHETLWADGQPGAVSGHASFLASLKLHKLNRRALLALLGIKASYIHTPWWRTAPFPFDG